MPKKTINKRLSSTSRGCKPFETNEFNNFKLYYLTFTYPNKFTVMWVNCLCWLLKNWSFSSILIYWKLNSQKPDVVYPKEGLNEKYFFEVNEKVCIIECSNKSAKAIKKKLPKSFLGKEIHLIEYNKILSISKNTEKQFLYEDKNLKTYYIAIVNGNVVNFVLWLDYLNLVLKGFLSTKIRVYWRKTITQEDVNLKDVLTNTYVIPEEKVCIIEGLSAVSAKAIKQKLSNSEFDFDGKFQLIKYEKTNTV